MTPAAKTIPNYEKVAFNAGYQAGVIRCLHLIAKWLYMNNRDHRSLRDEMKALLNSKP